MKAFVHGALQIGAVKARGLQIWVATPEAFLFSTLILGNQTGSLGL